MKKEFIVTAEYGIHARPAKRLVDLAMTFDAEIFIEALKKEVNLKSIMGLMSLGIYKGEKVLITADGHDAKRALDAIELFIVNENLGTLL